MTDPTSTILEYFETINEIPRCSKNEAQIGRWLKQWAKERNLECRADKHGNLIYRLPATAGYENEPAVVLQGHMDMVCEKTPSSKHDFSKDPIISHREGDWLTARDTTLGADNGIAIAYMLALVEDVSIAHPPLELLFTVDEETGLNGAKLLEPGFIQGRTLINLDSEDEGVFTIGCAGGIDTTLTLKIDRQPLFSGGRLYNLVIGGLRGGHSGIDIHKHRGNANKILVRTLADIGKAASVVLVSVNGGSRKNAIPRDAQAVIWVPTADESRITSAVLQMERTIKQEYALSDTGLFIKLDPAPETEAADQGLTQASFKRFISLLLGLPDGVARMSAQYDRTVETSSNLATVSLTGEKITILASQRSDSQSRLEEITAAVHAIAALAGAQAKDSDIYPPWPPQVESAVLARSNKAYQALFGKEPVIQVIHAGLECAIIGDIYPGMDMISFGPTIRNPHSPDERILIPSIEKVWAFLAGLLKEMKNGTT